MVIKFILNILYTLCIVVCLLVIYSGVKNNNWAYVLGAAFACALVVVFKLRLLKDIKNTTKKQ